MNYIKITASASGPLDDRIGFSASKNDDIHPRAQAFPYTYEINVSAGDTVHLFLSGKKDDHTVIHNGTVTDTVEIIIDQVLLDSVDITNKFLKQCTYRHGYNGTGDSVNDAFYGTMGYNGEVIMQFDRDPVAWLANLC